MSVRTVVVDVPDNVYEQLEAQAQATDRSVDELVVQTLTRSLPPAVENDLPPALRSELQVMEHLSDEVLWQIAQSTMNQDKIALYDVLLERHQAGTLTAEGQEWLTRLREDADTLMLRKAHAYVLLQSRGHELPALEELHTLSS